MNGAELGGKIPPLAHIGELEGLEKGMKAGAISHFGW